MSTSLESEIPWLIVILPPIMSDIAIFSCLKEEEVGSGEIEVCRGRRE